MFERKGMGRVRRACGKRTIASPRNCPTVASAMPIPQPITFYNRHTGCLETEVVYGEGFLRFVYENPLGKVALEALVKRSLFSRWYGWQMDRPASQAKVRPFVEKYGLNAAQFAAPVDSYATFNDFFYRKLKPEARPIDTDPRSVVFPADGRHLIIENIAACDSFFIKGTTFDLAALLGDATLARKFAQGTMVISRLCPVDYHRFHFPCDGTPDVPVLLNGPLYSVNPIALKQRPSILWENKRYLTRVQTFTLGEVLYLEIGATCVGSVVHTAGTQTVRKGDEKGYFRFGGSCVITIYEPGRVELDRDLLPHARAFTEVYAWMGERCGSVV